MSPIPSRPTLAIALVRPTSAFAEQHLDCVDPVAGVDAPTGGAAAAPWRTITYAKDHTVHPLARLVLAPGDCSEVTLGARARGTVLLTDLDVMGDPLRRVPGRRRGALRLPGRLLDPPGARGLPVHAPVRDARREPGPAGLGERVSRLDRLLSPRERSAASPE